MRRLSDVLKAEYGEKVYRLSLSSGCTCPNRDGTVGTGGCTFCSAGGSGDFAAPLAPLTEQLKAARARISKKTDAKKFIAYFQSYTNTYGDVNRLRTLYLQAVRRPEIVILALGTRPDCLGPDVMAMLAELNRIKPVWVELGLQTVHGETARRINRGYELPVFEDAYRRLKAAGLTVIIHVIFGLPGETQKMMLDTVRYLAALDPPLDGVKLQMLHVLRGTALGETYARDPFPLLSLSEYAALIAESAKILPKQTVLHRMTGDGPKALLLAPDWTGDKKHVLNTLNRALREAEEQGACAGGVFME